MFRRPLHRLSVEILLVVGLAGFSLRSEGDGIVFEYLIVARSLRGEEVLEGSCKD